MRPVVTHSSRILVSALAVLLAVLVGTPKDPEAATNPHTRTTRAGAQRLESAEAVDHSFEDPHPVLDTASDDVSVIAQVGTDAPPGAVLPERALILAPPSDSTLLHTQPVQTRTLAPQLRPHLGRAPPLHS